MPVVIVRDDGGVSVMHDPRWKGLDDAAADIEHAKSVPGYFGTDEFGDPRRYVRHYWVDEVPTDRTFRDAWSADLSVDMPKARELWRGKMRAARAPQLAALDVDYQRADEAGDEVGKRRVAKRKQALRDVTKLPEIEAAATPEALKAVWPAELAG